MEILTGRLTQLRLTLLGQPSLDLEVLVSLTTGTIEYWLLAHFKLGEGVGRCRVARTVAISQVFATRPQAGGGSGDQTYPNQSFRGHLIAFGWR